MQKKELLSKLSILVDFERNIISLMDKQPKSFRKQKVLRKLKNIKIMHKKHIEILDESIKRIKRARRYAY